ncbi:helix-turn-helix transcriptional regulator [Psychrobacillus sp. FSL K6-2365]|uniref:helix-turn-helix transcriptional regulator n=1 Tax=Psychrobacillus sp. FSL K6-2365 TaxID=2921546 RepID=UPI0030FAFD8D
MRNNIANIRKEKGISKDNLAKMVGITANWLHHIESGKRKPSVGMLEKIAKNLGVPIKDIFLD